MQAHNKLSHTLQQPIHSGFTAASTASEVIKGIDVRGKVVVVTGGYSGIGLETTRVLSLAGAKVIVPARDYAKAAKALQGFEGVEIETLDLINPDSIDAFSQRFLATGRPLHILVNNAGIMMCPLARDTRGYESQFAANHLGHFQLVARLWPALRQANGARVVSVSSAGHRRSQVVFEDPNFEHRRYERLLAYAQSKTANILFAVALDKRGEAEHVRAFSLHPGGIVSTDLKRHLSDEDLRQVGVLDENGSPILDPARQLKTVQQGAATNVWCATSPQLNGLGGVYCENSDVSPLLLTDDAAQQADFRRPGVMPYAVSAEAAERLWLLSERLTGAGI